MATLLPVTDRPGDRPAAPSLIGLPTELFALMAAYLNLADVCRLRATCRTMVGHSATVAGACITKRCELVQHGAYAPEAVLAWAVGGNLTGKARQLSRDTQCDNIIMKRRQTWQEKLG